MAKLLLAQVLQRRKISKRQFAKLLGAEYSSVFRYFRKGYDPKLSMLSRWAKAIGCKVEDLYKIS